MAQRAKKVSIVLKNPNRWRHGCKYFLAVCVLYAGPVFGFDLFPLYQTQIETRKTAAILPKLNSEHSSHVLNYSPSIQSFLDFEESTKILDVSFGSLDSKEFFVQQRAKFEQNLSADWHFKFNWWQQGDYEQESSPFLWGLSRSFGEKWRWGLIGNAYYRKSQDDLGTELMFFQDVSSYWQFTYWRPDFQRNQRADTNVRWSIAPQMFGLKRFHKGASATHLMFLRVEPRYSEYTINTETPYASRRMSAGWATTQSEFRLQTQLDVKNEEDGQVEADYTFLQLRAERDAVLAEQNYTYGLGYFARRFQKTSDKAEYHDVLPFIWWHIHEWSMGYDMTVHEAQDSAQLSRSDHEDKIENRLNAKWRHKFSEVARMFLLFTVDIDELGGSRTWEGGAGGLTVIF